MYVFTLCHFFKGYGLVKKILCLLFAIVMFATNLFGYSLMFNYQLFDFLYTGNQIIKIDYDKATSQFKNDDFLVHLDTFSIEHNINISQYNFISETDLNIYSTNPGGDPDVHLESGTLPINEAFISNQPESDFGKQSGVFSFPITNWDVHMYEMNQVNNIGLGDVFYLSGADNKIISLFIKEFSQYGAISPTSMEVNSSVLVNPSLVIVVIFAYVLFVIGLFFYFIQNRKRLLLQELWGYDKKEILVSDINTFKYFVWWTCSLLFLGVAAFVFALGQTHFWIDYFLTYALATIVSLLILSLMMLTGAWITQYICSGSGAVRGRLPFTRMQWISALLKAVVSIVMFSVIASSLARYEQLSNKLEALDYWDKTQDVYRIQVGVMNDKVLDDLTANRDLNDRFQKFYKEIKKNNRSFLINSENYNVAEYNDGNPVYSYALDLTDSIDLYSPKGRSILIDENYLKINPISGSDGKPAAEQLKNKNDTLDILVPEQLKSQENKIIASYLEWFYFQSVEVANMYNEEMSEPLIHKRIDDFSINVIYTEEGQDYFTYDSYTGDNQNNITDPIAVLYNDSFDTSVIGANTTSSLFFLDDSKGSAYIHILPALKKTDVKEINNVVSVYNEANDQIVELQWKLFQQTIALIIAILFSIIFFSVFIWAYYNANSYQLTLKSLFGYSYWKRNQTIIIITAFSAIVSALLVYFVVHRTSYIFLMAGVVLAIDLLFANLLSSYFSKKNINKVLKGD